MASRDAMGLANSPNGHTIRCPKYINTASHDAVGLANNPNGYAISCFNPKVYQYGNPEIFRVKASDARLSTHLEVDSLGPTCCNNGLPR